MWPFPALHSEILVRMFSSLSLKYEFYFSLRRPSLTMRMFVEERRSGTIDLLTLAMSLIIKF